MYQVSAPCIAWFASLRSEDVVIGKSPEGIDGCHGNNEIHLCTKFHLHVHRTDSECQGTDCGHSTAEWNRDSQYPCGLHDRLQSRPRVVHIMSSSMCSYYYSVWRLCLCVFVCVCVNLYDLCIFIRNFCKRH